MKYALSLTTISRSGFGLLESVTCVAVLGAAGLLAAAGLQQQNEKKAVANTVERMKNLGSASVDYATEHGGRLPLPEAPGVDDWTKAGKPEAAEVWYNVLPEQLKARPVSKFGKKDAVKFYREENPLYFPGVTYPGDRFDRPYFAVGFNSLLQGKQKEQVRLGALMAPNRTVLFLERGLPDEKPEMKAQNDFSGDPAAGPRAFVARRKGKGLLLFVDGHLEARAVKEVLNVHGAIVPQANLVWTRDPDADPNR